MNPNLPAGEYLSLTEVATHIGIPVTTLRAYRSRPLKANPFPDPIEGFGAAEVWTVEVIDAWMANRPGKEWRKGQGARPDPSP